MKSQTTIEFTIIVAIVIVAAIVFVTLYLKYSYNSVSSISISSPDFVQSAFPLNLTHIILTVNGQISASFLNITFLFATSSGNVSYSIPYDVINSSKTQSGAYAYMLNITKTPTYNPYNGNYKICDIAYMNGTKSVSVLNINKC